MMKYLTPKNLLIVSMLSSVLVLSGCRTKPVYNVEQAPVVVGDKSFTLKDVSKAIIVSGSSLGWKMQEVKPGYIIGTLNVRKHMAKVEIPYTKTNYSIKYYDSYNLNYDGSTIHGNYNGWVQRLDETIRAHLKHL